MQNLMRICDGEGVENHKEGNKVICDYFPYISLHTCKCIGFQIKLALNDLTYSVTCIVFIYNIIIFQSLNNL